MAKIKWSALVSDVAKSLNGSTFARNRAGSYMRNKTTPVNPQTTFQMDNRLAFGAISAAWRNLTEEQRTSWNNDNLNFPYVDQFGDTKFLSGFSLYQKLNQNIFIANGTVGGLTTCPTPVAIVPPATVAIDFGLTDNELLLTVSPTPVTDQTVVVRMTRKLSNGRYFVKNDYRIVTTSATAITNEDITALYVARFGAFPAGGTVGIDIYAINTVTGQRSPSNVSLITVP